MKTDLISPNNFNLRYERQLRNIIKENQFHEFTDILIEIMLRRQAEFDLPPSRMIEEAQNLVKRLPSIKVVHKNDLSNRNWCAQSGPGGIKISYEDYKGAISGDSKRALDLYETLTHEVYHSIARNEQGDSGVKNKKFDSRGLNELINEAAANRACINYTEREKYFGIRKTGGYSNLTILSPLLARSFGVTEKEFLSAGIRQSGEYELLNMLVKNTLSNNLEENQKNSRISKNFIASVGRQIEILHNINIPMNKSQVIPERKKSDYRTKALTALIGTLLDQVSFRIENDKRTLSPQMVEDYDYSYKGIVGYVNTIFDEYKRKGLLNEKQVQEIIERTRPQIEGLCNRVLGINEVTKLMYTKNPPANIGEMVFYAKNGDLIGNPYTANYFGIRVPQNKYNAIYNIDTRRRHQEILDEDFGNRMWKNGAAIGEITGIFSEKFKEFEKTPKLSLIDKLKMFFKGNSVQKKLPPPTPYNNYDLSEQETIRIIKDEYTKIVTTNPRNYNEANIPVPNNNRMAQKMEFEQKLNMYRKDLNNRSNPNINNRNNEGR